MADPVHPTPPSRPRTRDPLPLSWQRLAAVSGILFAVLLLLTILIGGATTPEHGDPVGDWTTFAEDNEGKLRIAALLFGLAIYEFLWFLGYLRSVFGEAEYATRSFNRISYVVLASGAVAIAGLGLGVMLNAAAVAYTEPAAVVRGVSMASGAAFQLGLVGFAGMLLPIGLLNKPLGVFPSWLGYVALVGGIASLLTLGTFLSEEYDNVFGMFYPLAFLMLFIFCIGASLEFLKRLSRGDQDPRTDR